MITIINPYYPLDDTGTVWYGDQIVEYLEPGDFDAERHSVTLRRGTQGEMFAATLRDYEIVFTTDTNEVYLYNGTGKKLVGACITGTHDERPSPVIPGKLYFETDTFVLFVTSDGVWVQLTYSPAAISSHINAASPHSKHATLNNSNLVVENPASATTTPTVNSIPLSRSDSPTISGGWLLELDGGSLA